MSNTYVILVDQPEPKTPIRRPRHRWKYNTEVYFKVVKCKSADLTSPNTGQFQLRAVVNTVMKFQVPQVVGRGGLFTN